MGVMHYDSLFQSSKSTILVAVLILEGLSKDTYLCCTRPDCEIITVDFDIRPYAAFSPHDCIGMYAHNTMHCALLLAEDSVFK